MALTAGSVDADVSNTNTTLQTGDWFLTDRSGVAYRITYGNIFDQIQSDIAAAVTQTKTDTGYVTLPGGVILQWFSSSVIPSGTAVAQSLPISFPNGTLHAQATYINTGGAGSVGSTAIGQIVDKSTASSVTIANLAAFSAQFEVFVIGY